MTISYDLLYNVTQITRPIVLLVLTISIILVLIYFLFKFTYWYRRNIPYVKPVFPFGNFTGLFTRIKCTAEIAHDLYMELKSKGHKYGGLYFVMSPLFMPVDPALIKQILLNDFEYFSDRGVYYNEHKDPLSLHLFNLDTEPWRRLRSKLSPTFTSGKIKMMFHTMVKCAEEVVNVCLTKHGNTIDIDDLSVRYTIDVIGCCVFGLDCNSLQNPDDQFKSIANRVMNPPVANGLKSLLSLMCPKLLELSKFTITDNIVTEFFMDVMKQTFDHRQKNNIQRDDFVQLMIDMKNKDDMLDENAKSGMKMTWRVATAQAFVFFAAGFETSSMSINLCLYELCKNKQIQDKVREEIQDVIRKNGGKLTYEGLMSMTYLDMVLNETLRKYPPLSFLNRNTTKAYKIPNTDVVLEKGTKVLISLLGLHMDPDNFPDPQRFDPERFSDENKKKKTSFTFMPFGGGHRICIGARFGQVQTKVCLANLLGNFKFSLNPKTKPVKYRFTSFVLALSDPIYLDIERVST